MITFKHQELHNLRSFEGFGFYSLPSYHFFVLRVPTEAQNYWCKGKGSEWRKIVSFLFTLRNDCLPSKSSAHWSQYFLHKSSLGEFWSAAVAINKVLTRIWSNRQPVATRQVKIMKCSRGGSRGRVQGGVHPPPWDEAFFLFAFKICIPHQSVKSFLRGAPPPKKNPGSAPVHYLL